MFSYRLFLFALTVIAAVYLGFFAFDYRLAFDLLGHGAYWFILAAFLLWIHAIILLWRERNDRTGGTFRFRIFIWPVFFVLTLSSAVYVIQEKEFKVLMDEPVLAATARQMHFEREAFFFTGIYRIQNVDYPHSGAVDKRPFFYPFLVSVLHDLTGYRVANSFWLNALIFPVFLLMAYWFGRQLAQPYGGYLAVLLLVSTPLLPMIAASGGIDLLNVTMIALLLVVLIAFLQRPTRTAQAALVLTAVLGIQTRYETALFVLPVAAVILYDWLQKRRFDISWSLILAPLLLIPFAMQRLIMQKVEVFWQSGTAAHGAFSSHYLLQNLTHAFRFFFDLRVNLPGNWLLSVFFIVALGALLSALLVCRTGRLALRSKAATGGLLIALPVVLNFILLMNYHWGQLDDLAATRLVAPYLCLQVGCCLWALRLLMAGWSQKLQLGLIVCVVVFFCGIAFPGMLRAGFIPQTKQNQTVDWIMDLSAERRNENGVFRPLLLSEAPIVALVGGMSSLSSQVALRKLAELELHMHLKTFDEVWILYVRPNANKNKEAVNHTDRLWEQIEDSFHLQALDRRKLGSDFEIMLARVEGISPKALSPADYIRPNWTKPAIDYTGRMLDESVRYQEFVNTLPR